MDTITILTQEVTLSDDAPIQAVAVPVLHERGNYAVHQMIASVTGDDVKYLHEQYPVSYRPNGRRCPIWFTSKANAVKFCDWMAQFFNDGDLTRIKQSEGDIADTAVGLGGYL